MLLVKTIVLRVYGACMCHLFHYVFFILYNLFYLLQVLRGADKNVDMYIRTQNGVTVEQFQWTNEGNLDTVVNETGLVLTTLSVCCFCNCSSWAFSFTFTQ